MPDIVGAVASSSFTHTGNVRHKNEDAVLSLPLIGLWAIADGMGGHDYGDFASHCVISHLHKLANLRPRDALIEAVPHALQEANTEIFHTALHEDRVIGTTVVVLIMVGETYHCFWSGDSRCYLYRERHLECITQDHTEGELLRNAGYSDFDVRKDPKSNVLTHALGVDETATIDSVMGYIYEDDRFLLCSDGLTKVFNHIQLAHRVDQADIDQVNLDFLSDALHAGAPDNLSSILVSL